MPRAFLMEICPASVSPYVINFLFRTSACPETKLTCTTLNVPLVDLKKCYLFEAIRNQRWLPWPDLPRHFRLNQSYSKSNMAASE